MTTPVGTSHARAAPLVGGAVSVCTGMLSEKLDDMPEGLVAELAPFEIVPGTVRVLLAWDRGVTVGAAIKEVDSVLEELAAAEAEDEVLEASGVDVAWLSDADLEPDAVASEEDAGVDEACSEADKDEDGDDACELPDALADSELDAPLCDALLAAEPA